MLPSFPYNEKCPPSDSCIYTLTLNTSNELNSAELYAENFQQHSDPSQGLVTWAHNEFSSDVKHVYFIVPPEDVQLNENEVKISTVNLDNVIDSQNQVLKNESSTNFNKANDANNPATISTSLFDDKILTSSEINENNTNIGLTKNVEENMSESSYIPSYDDRLSIRDSLLPTKYCSKSNKRKIKCDKCKMELLSASQYYSHRNIHMQNDDKSSWFCSQCGDKLKGRNALKSHELQKHGEIRMFPCPYCVYSSRKLLLLEYHIQNVHHGEKKFNCKLCNKNFFRVHDLKMHLNIHLELKCYTCHLCGRQFVHSSNLIRHLRVHTKVKPYSCNMCNKRFSQLPSLLAHQVSHTSGGKCPDCNAKFRSVSGLKKHVKSIHKRKVDSKEINEIFYRNSGNNFTKSRFFNCKICYERFRYKKGLKMHEQTFHSNSSIPCKGCLHIFPTIQNFKSHACLRSKDIDQVDADSRNYKCSICYKNCESWDEAECHICESHSKTTSKLNIGITLIPEMYDNTDDTVVLYFNSESNSLLCSNSRNVVPNVESSVDQVEQPLAPLVKEKRSLMTSSVDENVTNNSIPKDKKRRKKSKTSDENLVQSIIKDSNGNIRYKCKYCTKEFTKKWNWSQHMGTHDSSMQKYACQLCMKSFSYRSTYTNHLKTHSSSTTNEIEKFSCSQCLKTYKSKGTLFHHVKRIHENKQNYFCTECSKGFYFKTALEYHMRVHKKELIYICCFCGRKFSHSSHLRRHEKIHTGERPHKCPHCPKSFIQPVTLRAHLRKHQDLNSCANADGKVEQYINASSKEIDVDDPEEESQQDFAVINLEEITDLNSYNTEAAVDFASFVGAVDSTL